MSAEQAAEAPKPLSVTEAEQAVLDARAALHETVDALTGRLDPRRRAASASQAAKDAAKLAVTDARGAFVGDGFPSGEPTRARNAKIVAGVAIAVVTVVVISVFARRR